MCFAEWNIDRHALEKASSPRSTKCLHIRVSLWLWRRLRIHREALKKNIAGLFDVYQLFSFRGEDNKLDD